ncbi:MAG: ABC transporter ATP-binding protein [Clostridiales bacterium]|nr:ABC transporter ATP-binding protein [Clostridiales bacterium]
MEEERKSKYMLQIKDLDKNFEDNRVLNQINLHIKKGEFTVIMGQSGCGKSTLLYCISGMDRPTAGEVWFDGKELSGLSEKEMEHLRLERMGFIFQKANLLKNLSIEDNIIYPAFSRIALKKGERRRKEIVQEAEALMSRLGILEIAGQDIRRVSGGQLQRAAICRAMINHPDILLGDEPTGALNSSATKEVMDILNAINREGTTVLLVTHDAKVAARADRVIYLEDGRNKAELLLGRYEQTKQEEREEQMKEWLGEMGF